MHTVMVVMVGEGGPGLILMGGRQVYFFRVGLLLAVFQRLGS